MKITQKVKVYEDDTSKYRVGDVLKCWHDCQDSAVYNMIVSFGAEYHLVALNGLNDGCICFHFAYGIPTLIDDYKNNYKHIQRVRFEGLDLGRKVGDC